MIIKITHVINEHRTLNLELSTRDVDTSSYLGDRPDLVKMIEDAIRNMITTYSYVHDRNETPLK